jgi:hypothetical protein
MQYNVLIGYADRRANGLELSGVAAETMCQTNTDMTANEKHTLKDSR